MKYYTLSLDRVTGVLASGKYNTGGTFSFQKFATLTEAKNAAAEEFKRGYFNHAEISNSDAEIEIERFKGEDWRNIA